MQPLENSFRGRSVLLTGHTGFKGAWLALWLQRLGAKVHGYALPPATADNLYAAAQVAEGMASDTRADLADLSALKATLARAQPEIVLHLAAQALVRESYRSPLETFSTNILGTAHVMEAVRATPSVRAVTIITTDKVYENREWEFPYREVDPLGGHDPYSASKAAAELVTSSYRASFFSAADRHPARVATARAGNVIGGGDWSPDRLVPDCLRAFAKGEPVHLRYPHAVRPWQHVLEPLSGYLQLTAALLGEDGDRFAKAYNFGPDSAGDLSVGEIAREVARLWGDSARVVCESTPPRLHEAGLLRLDSTRARQELAWRPRWTAHQALERTVSWHQAWRAGARLRDHSLGEIEAYQSLMAKAS